MPRYHTDELSMRKSREGALQVHTEAASNYIIHLQAKAISQQDTISSKDYFSLVILHNIV